jgi:catechol 2,3-dioxygenase-like lactoylglutathione lyase family enzyme
MCWGIEPWDTKKVEAELKKRGLNPVADHKGSFQSFHVKDPDGFDVQLSNGNRRNRRTTPANGKLTVALPFEPTGWKSVWLDHISFSVTSYKETTAFYAALLGWKPEGDEGSQNTCEIAPDIGGIIIRGGNANAPGGLTAGRGGRGGASGDSTRPAGPPPPLVRRAVINHISFGLADFDYQKVRAELEKRGLNARVDTGGAGDIATARYKSYHTTTPNGWDLQISNTIRGDNQGSGSANR